MRKAQQAKDELEVSDSALFSSPYADLSIDVSTRTDLTKIADMSLGEPQRFTLEKVHLPVKKPDLLGHSQWQMKLGQRTIRASISDAVWLNLFQDRDVSLKPGDALKCDADYTILMDTTGTPIAEKMDITKVYSVEYKPPGQQVLL